MSTPPVVNQCQADQSPDLMLSRMPRASLNKSKPKIGLNRRSKTVGLHNSYLRGLNLVPRHRGAQDHRGKMLCRGRWPPSVQTLEAYQGHQIRWLGSAVPVTNPRPWRIRRRVCQGRMIPAGTNRPRLDSHRLLAVTDLLRRLRHHKRKRKPTTLMRAA